MRAQRNEEGLASSRPSGRAGWLEGSEEAKHED
jgi:hypothetical protein